MKTVFQRRNGRIPVLITETELKNITTNKIIYISLVMQKKIRVHDIYFKFMKKTDFM